MRDDGRTAQTLASACGLDPQSADVNAVLDCVDWEVIGDYFFERWLDEG